jgi:hypothetical protein
MKTTELLEKYEPALISMGMSKMERAIHIENLMLEWEHSETEEEEYIEKILDSMYVLCVLGDNEYETKMIEFEKRLKKWFGVYIIGEVI